MADAPAPLVGRAARLAEHEREQQHVGPRPRLAPADDPVRLAVEAARRAQGVTR